MVATGHSQSAGRLRTYANSIQPLANILDAVVLHGGGGAMRTDTPMPVFRINSEGDISFGIGNGARAPDSPTFRNWEVAGASHGDWKLITDYGPLRKRDIGTYPGGYPGEPQTCTLPSLSRVPQHMVQNARLRPHAGLGRVRHRSSVGAGDLDRDARGRRDRA